jgi:tripartite-type tricarboxylate transporter receptor subunit TctC
MKLKKLIAISMLTALAAGQAWAQATDYPTRPIKLLVGFTAGGATDVSARLFAKVMGDVLGQSVIVDNRTGAAGTVAADLVAHSPHDGYTLLYTTSSIHGIAPHIYPKLGWDPIKDFAPIALAAKYPQALIANNDIPAKTLPELIALMKKSPGKYSYASAGTGGTQHLAAALLNAQAKTEAVHVPYKGMSAAYSDLMSGRIQFMFDNAPSAIPFINSGKVRGLAVTSATRMSALPNVPTVAESGFPSYEVEAWSGFVAPAGTPQAVIDKLNDAVKKATQAPEVKRWLTENGSPTNLAGTPAEFGDFLKRELVFWKKAVDISGAKLE